MTVLVYAFGEGGWATSTVKNSPCLPLTIVFFVEFFETRKPVSYFLSHLILTRNGRFELRVRRVGSARLICNLYPSTVRSYIYHPDVSPAMRPHRNQAILCALLLIGCFPASAGRMSVAVIAPNPPVERSKPIGANTLPHARAILYACPIQRPARHRVQRCDRLRKLSPVYARRQ